MRVRGVLFDRTHSMSAYASGRLKVRTGREWRLGDVELVEVTDGVALVTPYRHRCRETVESDFPRARGPGTQRWYHDMLEGRGRRNDSRAILLLPGKTAFDRAVPWAERRCAEEAELEATVDLRVHEGALLATGVVSDVSRDSLLFRFRYDKAAVDYVKVLPHAFFNLDKSWSVNARSVEDVDAIVRTAAAIAALLTSTESPTTIPA